MKIQLPIVICILLSAFCSNAAASPQNIEEFMKLTKAVHCPEKSVNKSIVDMCFVTRNSILASLQRFCQTQDCKDATADDLLSWLNSEGVEMEVIDGSFVKERNEENYIESLKSQFEFHCSWFVAYKIMNHNASSSVLIHHKEALQSVQGLLKNASPDEVGEVINKTCPKYYEYIQS